MAYWGPFLCTLCALNIALTYKCICCILLVCRAEQEVKEKNKQVDRYCGSLLKQLVSDCSTDCVTRQWEPALGVMATSELRPH